jgi:hypothetical protein
MRTINDFAEIVLCDFEYHHGGLEDGPPVPVCCCALELRSGKQYRLWSDQLCGPEPPWRHTRDTLFVSYSAPAELGCYAALGWPFPEFVLDLLIEFRWLVNGELDKHASRSLTAALDYFKLPGLETEVKEEWRQLILRGGPFDAGQKEDILTYCWNDVASLNLLLPAILQRTPRDLDRALLRSRYTLAVTQSMSFGIPIDAATWKNILHHREAIQKRVAARCPIYDGIVFKMDRFERWIEELGLTGRWPQTPTGLPSTEDRAFKRFRHLPEVDRVYQVRQVVEDLRKPPFNVHGTRNYYTLLPFLAQTSRNATKRSIYQAGAWWRGLLQPSPGTALLYAITARKNFLWQASWRTTLR